MLLLHAGGGDLHHLLLAVVPCRLQHQTVVGSKEGALLTVEEDAVVVLRIHLSRAPETVLPDEWHLAKLHHRPQRIGGIGLPL